MLTINSVLSAANQSFLNKLQQLDLELIADQLMQSGWSRQQISCAIKQYRMFLFLIYLHPNTQLVPTQEIDLVWHCHILNTRKYRKDCQMLFGRYIDHEPDSQFWGKVDSISLDTAFAQTQALFEQYFNQAALGDTISVQLDRREVAECRPEQKKKSDREWMSLRYHRSACGRPSYEIMNYG
ncbi:MAG: glycine-rich domain-containing protein-like [Cyanobacteriota bacterium]